MWQKHFTRHFNPPESQLTVLTVIPAIISHFHLVPKYTDGYEWGGTFAMNPGEKFLSDEEYAALIDEIKKYL